MKIRLLHIQWITLVFLVLAMTYGLIPWQIAAVFFLGFFLIMAWTNMPETIVMLAFTNPFLNLVRNVGPDSVILAGWREIVLVMMVGVTLIRSRQIRPLKIFRTEIIILNLLIYYLMIQIFLSPNLYIGLLGFRENGAILMLIPLIIIHFRDRENFMMRLIIALLVGGMIVGFMDIWQYYLPSSLLPENIAEDMSQRVLFGQEVYRLIGYFGVGPSGVASYYTLLAVLGFSVSQLPGSTTGLKMVGYASFALTLFASMLTVSLTTYTTVIMAFLGLAYMNVRVQQVTGSFFFIFVLLVATFYALANLEIFSIVDLLNKVIYRYRTEFFILITWPQKLLAWLFGLGYSIRTGRLLGDIGGSGALVVDTGWFGILTQFGILGASLYFLLILLAVNAIRQLKGRHALARGSFSPDALPVILWVASLGYVHGAPISQRPIDLIFAVMLAFLRIQSKLAPTQGGFFQDDVTNRDLISGRSGPASAKQNP